MIKAKLWLVMVIMALLVLLAVACSPVSDSEATPTPSPTDELDEPWLSDDLKRDCQLTPGGNFDNAGLAIGETAVDFVLQDIHGSGFQLSRLLAEKPVVLIFGSFT